MDWSGQTVKFVVGIAAKGDEHLALLARIVEAFEEESAVEALVASADADAIYDFFTSDQAQS